jgi:hypothetical protein
MKNALKGEGEFLPADAKRSVLEALVPDQEPSPEGGRHPTSKRLALAGIFWVLEIGIASALTAQALSPSEDTDGDGLNDAAELLLAALGCDWQGASPRW